MKITDSPFFIFLKQPHLFYQALYIYGKKNLNPLSLSSLIKEEGVPTIPYLFKVKKAAFIDWKIAATLSV